MLIMKKIQIPSLKILFGLLLLLTYSSSHSQTVTNGSITGTAAGNSAFSMVAGWNNCVLAIGNTPDVCDINLPSWSGNTMVAAAASPDGGEWVGLANGVNPIEQECIEGEMTGLTVGNTYSLEFYGACFGTGPAGTYANSGPATGQVSIDGVIMDTVYAPQVAMVWNTYCIPFTANAATMNFTIQNLFGGGYLCLDGFTVGTSGVSLTGTVLDTTICNTSPYVIDATVANGTYVWQDNSTNPTFTTSTPGQYWVNVSTGCTSYTDTFNVTFATPPVVDLGNDTTLCPGQNLLMDVTNAGATYLWQDNSTNPTFNATTDGTYWVEVTLGNCVVVDSIIIDYNTISGVDLGNDTALCTGQTLLLDPNIAGATYVWQDNSTNATFNVTAAGQYWVDVTTACATGTDTINVTYNPDPVINLGNDTALCEGQTLLLDATTNPGAIYLWQDNSTNATFNVNQAGTYTVQVTENGCSASDNIDVTYTPLPVVDLGPDQSLCFGDQAVLDATTAGATYLWQDNSTNPTFTATQTGTYSVTVTVNNCSAQDAVDITVSDATFFNIIADTVGCEGEQLQFSDATTSNSGTIQSWNWDFGDGQSGSARSVGHGYTSSGVYTVTLEIITALGCTLDTSFQVTIYSQPKAGFTYLPTDPKLEEVVEFTDQSENGLTWQWIFGDGNYDNLPNTSHVYTFPHTYSVMQVVRNNICVDTAVASIPLLEELLFYIPNAFTPDENSFNPTFTPVFTSGYDPYNFRMTIYNRWGEVVFITQDAGIGWDGNYASGEKVQNGVYIWRIEFGNVNNDEIHSHEGHVTLIR